GRRQDTLLIFLECRRHVPLRTCERLPALIVVRNSVAVRVGEFDVVTEYTVVADLERADSSSCALLALNTRDSILSAIAQRAQLVQITVEAGTNGWIFTQRNRRALDQQVDDVVTQLLARVPACKNRLQCITSDPARCSLDVRQSRDRIAQCAQLARSDAARGDFCREPLDVAHTIQRCAHCRTRHGVGSKCCNGAEARFYAVHLRERCQHPLT